MHPADVADHVAESVAMLRARLAERSDFRTGSPELEDDVRLFIPFTLRERKVVDTALPTGLFAPGGEGLAMASRVVDLGQPPVDRSLLLALELDDYDGQPPTAQLLLPERSPLPPADWPKSLNAQGIIEGYHPNFDRPWFCRRGLREYHTHPRHEDDSWDLHREGLPLYGIVEELLSELTQRFIGR